MNVLLKYQENLPFIEAKKFHFQTGKINSDTGIEKSYVRKRESNTEKILSYLLEHDLTFKGERTNYATHNIHAFAAKFPPQLPRFFINELTTAGEVILDPMSGSGTALVEAVLSDRYGIGIDIDPLAVMIAKVKYTPLNISETVKIGNSVLQAAKKKFRHIDDAQLRKVYSPEAAEFFRYWFEQQTVDELFALVREIEQVKNSDIQTFLKVVFSSCIITKSGGLTLARDLAHSRPHRDPGKKIKQNAFNVFSDRFMSCIHSVESLSGITSAASVIRADSRSLPLPSESVHLIVTSPPYAANAIDYMRAHKFSLIWFGFEPKKLSTLRRRYIGSEIQPESFVIPSKTGKRIIQELQKKEKNRAAVVAHYFREMESSLREMLRVLVKGRAAVLIVGSSVIKGTDIKAPTVLAEIAGAVGFRVIGVAKRDIVRDSRMMPVSHNSERNGIEARMHEEGVIGLIKSH
jgi:DNA modification methylase